jgi:hypothetical protein
MENLEHSNQVSRRRFNRLTMAAFGGAVLGALGGGCGHKPPAEAGATSARLLQEPHVCRGLNTCKGKGAGGTNQCAGQGQCATAAHHTCHKENACKGQGGCGSTAGLNACKGQGECAVPLSDGTWAKVRAAFEKEAAAAGIKIGANMK